MQRSSLWKISLVVFAVVGAVFLNGLVLGDFLQNLFYKVVAKPGVFLINKLTGLPRLGKGFLNSKTVVMKNKKLEEENKVFLGRIAESEGLKRENEFLRKELKVAPRLESRLLIVEIFSIQRNALSSTALINKGKADGVRKSMAVITSGNILAGVVDQVFDNSALLLLLDDPRSVVSVRIQETNILAEARGKLDGNFRVDLITHKEEVKEGSIIVASGLDGLKESLLVGRISQVGTGSSGLFKEVTGKPLFDLSLGSELFVILE